MADSALPMQAAGFGPGSAHSPALAPSPGDGEGAQW